MCGNERKNDGLSGWVVDSTGSAEYHQQTVDGPETWDSCTHFSKKTKRGQRHHREDDNQNLAPAVPIGDESGYEHEGNHGKKGGNSN